MALTKTRRGSRKYAEYCLAWSPLRKRLGRKGGLNPGSTKSIILRALLLKVLDDVIHCRKPVDATNPILRSFNAKQVANRGMGLDET